MIMYMQLSRFVVSIAITTVIACTLPSLAPAAEPELKGGAMLDCSGLPCVEATTASGTHIKMLLDTGDFRPTLDESVARKLGLEIKPFIGRDGKPRPEYSVASLQEVKIGEGSLGDISVVVANLQPDIQKGKMPHVDGSLTYDAFGARLLRIDPRQCRDRRFR